jgi:hypothetical protein
LSSSFFRGLYIGKYPQGGISVDFPLGWNKYEKKKIKGKTVKKGKKGKEKEEIGKERKNEERKGKRERKKKRGSKKVK